MITIDRNPSDKTQTQLEREALLAEIFGEKVTLAITCKAEDSSKRGPETYRLETRNVAIQVSNARVGLLVGSEAADTDGPSDIHFMWLPALAKALHHGRSGDSADIRAELERVTKRAEKHHYVTEYPGIERDLFAAMNTQIDIVRTNPRGFNLKPSVLASRILESGAFEAHPVPDRVLLGAI